MAIRLRPMTQEEFVPYERADAERYAENMARVGFWARDGALGRARESHKKLLPEGLKTPGHFFFVIEQVSEKQPIGALWMFADLESSPPSGFIYDVLIDEAHRRRGYGQEAMVALEDKAAELGLSILSLHVFEDNEAAKALYKKLGYEGSGAHISKELRGKSSARMPNHSLERTRPARREAV
jgi:RimJ/RimL family protein N-acetyltransferase